MKEALLKIQNELKCSKSQFNSFGGYSYRSCEDILEAVKPLCEKHNLLLTLSDEIVEVGGRVYVKATASLTDATIPDWNNAINVTAYAREAEVRKGMDCSQITGASSSYARKYALNGMFCIEDQKDADSLPSPEEKVNAYSGTGTKPPTFSESSSYEDPKRPPIVDKPVDKSGGTEDKLRNEIVNMLESLCNGNTDMIPQMLGNFTEFQGDKGPVRVEDVTRLKGKWLFKTHAKIKDEWNKIWGEEDNFVVDPNE